MITSIERKAAADFVLSDPNNLKTALAVYDAWTDVTDRVCEQFLKGLCSRIEASVKEKLKEFAHDMRVDYTSGNKEYRSTVWLYRECWEQYPETKEQKRWPYMRSRRTSILLQNQSKGPNNWGIGVSSPMSKEKLEGKDKERRLNLPGFSGDSIT